MGDPFDFMDETALVYPEKFEENIVSTKWKERFDAIDDLLNHVKKNPKLDSKADYNELVFRLKHVSLLIRFFSYSLCISLYFVIFLCTRF